MSVAVKELIDAGVHFGHRASRWNPKMKPYIYSKRNLIHIIDLKETVRGLLRAIKYFNRVAASGGLILFVGTKRQAADTVIQECQRSGMPYVTERWLGGTLTNFRTIRNRLQRLDELEGILGSDQALTYSKKMLSTYNREARKIRRNLEGLRNMPRLPEALFVIDPRREKNAVSEARKLGIKVVALMDTDCDPDLVDLPIPGNDDSMRSIELVLKELTDAIIEGKASAPTEPAPGARPEEAIARAGERRGERRPLPGGRGPGGLGAGRVTAVTTSATGVEEATPVDQATAIEESVQSEDLAATVEPDAAPTARDSNVDVAASEAAAAGESPTAGDPSASDVPPSAE